MVVENENGGLDTGRYSGHSGGSTEFGPLFIVCPRSHGLVRQTR